MVKYLVKGTILSDILHNHIGEFLLGSVGMGIQDILALLLRSDGHH